MLKHLVFPDQVFEDYTPPEDVRFQEQTVLISLKNYSIASDYATKVAFQIRDRYSENQKVNRLDLEAMFNEYFDWLLYLRIAHVREEAVFIDVADNRIVVPDFLSCTLENVGIAYSENHAIKLVPKYADESPFTKYGKTVDEARAFVIGVGQRLYNWLKKARLCFAQGIICTQTGDYQTMLAEVGKMIVTAGDHVVSDDLRPFSETVIHPVKAAFVAMLGIRQVERAIVSRPVYYDSFTFLKDEVLRMVTYGKQATVPRRHVVGESG